MADISAYHSKTYDPNGNPFDPFDLFNEIAIFLRDTVANGWTYFYYTGQEQGGFNPAAVDWHGQDSDPLTEAYESAYGTGAVGFANNPTELTSQQSKTVYVRWDDGTLEDWDGYFYMSNLKVKTNESGPIFTDIRVGYLDHQAEKHIESPVGWSAWYDDGGAGWFIPPNLTSQDPTIFGYSYWPTGTQAPETRSLASPYSYKSQKGYTPDTETVTSRLQDGNQFDPDAPVIAHIFGGVENGAPYLYCTLESGIHVSGVHSKIYAHFGFGKLKKFGDYIGGSFATGTQWHPSYLSSVGTEYNSALFCTWNCRYVSYRSTVAYNGRDKTPINRDTEFPHGLQRYLFGYSYNNYPYTAYSACYGNGLATYLMQDGKVSGFNNKLVLIPNYIHVRGKENPDYYELIGVAPGMRSGWIKHIKEGDEITYNGQTWKAFPILCRNGENQYSSQDHGYFFRKA